MPATTAPTQTLENNQRIAVDVELYAFDGVTLDTTTPLAVTHNVSPALISATIDPDNNRRVLIRATNNTTTVTASVTINRQAPGTPSPLVVPCQLIAAVDRSKVVVSVFNNSHVSGLASQVAGRVAKAA